VISFIFLISTAAELLETCGGNEIDLFGNYVKLKMKWVFYYRSTVISTSKVVVTSIRVWGLWAGTGYLTGNVLRTAPSNMGSELIFDLPVQLGHPELLILKCT
jgi:hypothetical protein